MNLDDAGTCLLQGRNNRELGSWINNLWVNDKFNIMQKQRSLEIWI